ncbi:uncharacterized protein LOC144915967 isoform X1 [Branchiostoma floridae x Branchiostoma belcheri]
MDMNSVGKGPKERHIAFLLADALRQEDAEKFLEVYDTVIPQEMPLDEVDHIKERARELSELPEEIFQQEFRLVKQSLTPESGQPQAGQSGGGQSTDLPEEYYQRKRRLQKRPPQGCSSVSTGGNNTDNPGQAGKTGTCGQALKHAKVDVLEKIAKTTSALAALQSATTELTVIQESGLAADDQEKEEQELSATSKHPISTRATLPSLSQLYKTAEKLKASSEQLRKMWENRESEKPPFGYPPDATSITKSAMTLLNKGEAKEGDTSSLDAICSTGLERRGSLDSGKDDDRQYESSGSRRSSVSQGGRKKKKKKKKANKSGKQQSVGALKSASSECSIDSDSGTINSQDGASSNSIDSGKSNASNPEKKETTDPIVIEKTPENPEKLTLTSNGLSKDMVKRNAARIGSEIMNVQQQNSTEIPLTPGTMQDGTTKPVGQSASSPWGGGMTYASKLKAGLEKFREGENPSLNKDAMDGEGSGNIVLPEGSDVIVPNGLPVVEICLKEDESTPREVGGAYDNAKSQEGEGCPHPANLEKNVTQSKGTGKVDLAEVKGPSEAYARKVCTRATPLGAVSCSETLGKEDSSLQAILLNFENSPFQFLSPSEVFDGPNNVNADSAIQGSNESKDMSAAGDAGKVHVRVSRDFSLTPPEVPQYEFGLGNTVLPGSIGVVMMDNAAVKNVDMTKGNYVTHKEDPGVHTERPPVPSVPEEITYNFQEAANYLYREWEQTFKQCQEDPTKVQYYKSGLSA